MGTISQYGSLDSCSLNVEMHRSEFKLCIFWGSVTLLVPISIIVKNNI